MFASPPLLYLNGNFKRVNYLMRNFGVMLEWSTASMSMVVDKAIWYTLLSFLQFLDGITVHLLVVTVTL